MRAWLHALIAWLLKAVRPADARDCICHRRARAHEQCWRHTRYPRRAW